MLGLSTFISAREDYLGVFETHGVALTGLNTSGNPTSPLPNEGLKHAEDLFKTIDLASKRLAGLIGHVHAKDTKIFPGPLTGACWTLILCRCRLRLRTRLRLRLATGADLGLRIQLGVSWLSVWATTPSTGLSSCG